MTHKSLYKFPETEKSDVLAEKKCFFYIFFESGVVKCKKMCYNVAITIVDYLKEF